MDYTIQDTCHPDVVLVHVLAMHDIQQTLLVTPITTKPLLRVLLPYNFVSIPQSAGPVAEILPHTDDTLAASDTQLVLQGGSTCCMAC